MDGPTPNHIGAALSGHSGLKREMRSWEGNCRGKSGHGFEQNMLYSCVRFLNDIKSSSRDSCWDLTVNGRWLSHSQKLKQNLESHRAGWHKQASTSTGRRPNRGLPYSSAVNRNSHDGWSLRKTSTWRLHGLVKRRPHLNRNDDPRLKRTGFGFGLGSSKSLKKA